MRVLHQMPSLESEQDRAAFYDWWGTESTIINATTKHCYYGPYRQRLSIKCAFGGPEHYRADNRSFRVEDKSFLVLSEGCVTESFIGYDRPVNSFSIFFGPDRIEECFAGRQDHINAAHSLPSGLRDLNQPAGQVLHQLWSFTRDRRSDSSELEGLLDELLICMAESELTEASRGGVAQRQALAKLNRARDFIESQYPDSLSLNDIARQAAMSPFHLSRAFKKQFGISPMAYLKRKRVETADRLIREQGLKIGDAAARVGFVSRATFLRHYRRRFGNVPSGRSESA